MTARWYAKTDAHTSIAEGETFSACSAAAIATGVWDQAPGTVAPYYLTTIPPEPRA